MDPRRRRGLAIGTLTVSRGESPAPDRLLKSALALFVVWFITLLGVVGLYAELRETNALSVLETRYEGGDAFLIVGIAAAIPITLFALALKKLADYKRLKQR